MNLTLSAESRVIEAAREWASNHGTTINSLVRDYLVSLATVADTDEVIKEFCQNARQCAGNSGGNGAFSRAELYQGKRFGDTFQ